MKKCCHWIFEKVDDAVIQDKVLQIEQIKLVEQIWAVYGCLYSGKDVAGNCLLPEH